MRETAPRNFVGDRAGPSATANCTPQLTLPNGGDHHHATNPIHLVELPTADEAINLSIARLQDTAPDWKSGSLDFSSWARTIHDWVNQLWPMFIPRHSGSRAIHPPRILLAFRRER